MFCNGKIQYYNDYFMENELDKYVIPYHLMS
jgi:hypothetical protein